MMSVVKIDFMRFSCICFLLEFICALLWELNKVIYAVGKNYRYQNQKANLV